MTEATQTLVEKPSYGELIDRSWKDIKDQLALAAGLTLVFLLVAYALNRIPFLGPILNSFISVGYIACLYRIRQKTEFGFADFLWAFKNMNRFLNVLLMSVLSTVLTLIGFCLLIIPGIWMFVVLSLSSVAMVQGTDDGIEALKKSRELVRGNWWYMAGVLMMSLVLNILGVMCFAVGLLFSVPVTMMMLINVFEVLSKTPRAPTTEGSSTPGSSSFAVNP